MSKVLKFDNTVITLDPLGRTDLDNVEQPRKLFNKPLPGKPCPKCNDSILDFDGLLNLVCENCGYTLTGCST